jgi:hypothetical protein
LLFFILLLRSTQASSPKSILRLSLKADQSIGVRDWIKNDSNGALRIAAWKDGGVNDICPAGFSVPNKGELP